MQSLSQPSGTSRGALMPPAQVLVIVCAGVVLASLDLFIVNVALPRIAVDLHASSLGDLSWVLSAYAIVYAALLVPMGRLADQHRRKHGFLLGTAIFTLASVACATAGSVGMLVAFRVVQAAGAALLTPASLSLVLASYPAEGRGGAVRAWAAVGGVAAALGPVAGGLLVAASWRWVFLVNVPVGLGALVVGWWRLPEVPGFPGPRPDTIGLALGTASIGTLSLGLVQGGAWGWTSPATVAVLAISMVLLGAFVARCVRHDNPLIDPALFAVRSFAASSVVMVLFSTSFGAMLLSLVLWMQGPWGWSPLQTGLGIAPGPMMVPLFAFVVAGRLIRRFGPGPVVALGLASLAAGAAWWALAAGLRPDYVGGLLGGMLLTGVGVGLTLPTLMAAATSSLPAKSFATGSAVVNMLRQVGLGVGVAVLVAVVGTPRSAAARLSAFEHGWLVIAAVALMAAGCAAVLFARAGAQGVKRSRIQRFEQAAGPRRSGR